MRIIGRVSVALVAAVAAVFASAGISHAGLDNELSVVDGKGRTMTVQQWDTFLNGVFPMDRQALTREWFHSGRAAWIVAGDGAADFEGELELGYQIGVPWSMGNAITFSYETPNLNLDEAVIAPAPEIAVTSPPLFPGVAFEADLSNGPGIQEVSTFSVEIKGANGNVAVNNAHGTVTGVAGGVLLRPFARLKSSDGDSVTTYGEPWNMN